MKRFLLCFLWVIFDIPASAQTESAMQKDTLSPVVVQDPYNKKLTPFNAHMFLNARVPVNPNKFSMLSNYRPVTYQFYGRTSLQTFMEVTGTLLSLIINPRAQPYIPPPNRR